MKKKPRASKPKRTTRTPAQIAATKRMLAAAAAKRKGAEKPATRPQRATKPKAAKRKKQRTPAQIAATQRMLEANGKTSAQTSNRTTKTRDKRFF